MKIFISHSSKDKEAVSNIVTRLEQDGHEVWVDTLKLKPGDNISKKIEEGLIESDAFIVVISSNSLRSQWVRQEFSTIALQQIFKRQQRIIPVRIEDCPVPSYLADRLYIDFFSDFEAGLNTLSIALQSFTGNEISTSVHGASTITERSGVHVQKLHDALRKGRLTLVCGAGVSVGAGIPTWGNLLLKLLEALMEKMSQNHHLDIERKAAAEFQKKYGASSLILGKYLKNNLGRDFVRKVREALYFNEPTTCPLIDSVIDLSRTQRDAKSLDSIITFNFDGLIEEQLNHNHIPNRAIFSESLAHTPEELPVYHVHGYLPRKGKLLEDAEIVFSEDAYHSQFIDPYSWSNLIQLSKLTQNTCLFVGISLTDPNMRRLLDVAWRKNPDKTTSHYILKRTPQFENGDPLYGVTRLLEEQDANALGLSVIWFDSYGELPSILKQIVTT